METSVFPNKIRIDEPEDVDTWISWPYTIVVWDEDGSVMRVHLSKRIAFELGQKMHEHSGCRLELPKIGALHSNNPEV